MSKKKLVMLTVLDGFGLRENQKGNAVTAARKPNIDYLFNTYPHTQLWAQAVKMWDYQKANEIVKLAI